MCGRRWSIRPQPDYALHRATVQSRPNPRGGTELQDKYQTWLAWGRPLLAWLCNGRLRAREGGLLFRMSHGRARRWFGSWLHRANFLAVGPHCNSSRDEIQRGELGVVFRRVRRDLAGDPEA